MYLQARQPDHHLSADSKDAVKLATGIIATMAALLLGLLISSAKSSFDQINNELVGSAANVVVLDRTLADYGPETGEIRDSLKVYYKTRVNLETSGKASEVAKLDSAKMVHELEDIRAKVLHLSPGNDAQRELQNEALHTMGEMVHARWLLMLQKDNSVSIPLVALLVAWLSIIFAAFGLFSPCNKLVVTKLFLSALSVSAAIFLILELNGPLTGLVTVSKASLYDAIAHLGQ
ncbi:MAG TPA: hypothetical protein PLH03_01420 [Methylophilaceae bacterium]|nr:hypothetical protein [Methylophilaceae bacterium]